MNFPSHTDESRENRDPSADDSQQSWHNDYTAHKLKKPLSQSLKKSIESVYGTIFLCCFLLIFLLNFLSILLNFPPHTDESRENKDPVDDSQQSWHDYTVRKLKKPLSQPLKRSIESVYGSSLSHSSQRKPLTSQHQIKHFKNEPVEQRSLSLKNGIIANYHDDDDNLQFENSCRYGDFSVDEKNFTTTISHNRDDVVVVDDSEDDTYDYKKIESGKSSSNQKMLADDFIYLKNNKKNNSEENKLSIEEMPEVVNKLKNNQHEFKMASNLVNNETSSLLPLYEEKAKLEIELLKKKIERENIQINLMNQGKLIPLTTENFFPNTVAQTEPGASEQFSLEVPKESADIQKQLQGFHKFIKVVKLSCC